MKIIIVDLDGTVADHTHRVSKLSIGFDEYNSLLHLDTPIDGVISILDAMFNTHIILFITGRPVQYKTETIEWLFKHRVAFHELYMRPDGDMRSDTVLKAAALHSFLNFNGFSIKDVAFVLEDRDCVVKMWRGMGLTCLQVNNFEISKESLNVN